MKRLVMIAMLATVPACTLVGLGAGAAFDNAVGTDSIGKTVGLRVGLGIDLALIAMVRSLFGA